MSDFDVLRFVADNAGMNIFDALIKAYKQGSLDTIEEVRNNLINADGLGRKGTESVLNILEQMKEQNMEKTGC